MTDPPTNGRRTRKKSSSFDMDTRDITIAIPTRRATKAKGARSATHVSNVLIQTGEKTELQFPTERQRSTTSVMRRIADAVQVQRWRGLSADGASPIRSPRGRSELAGRTGRGYVGRSGQGGRRERWFGVELRKGRWGLSPTRTPGSRIFGPIADGGWLVAFELPRLPVQVVPGIHRQLCLHVFRVQGSNAAGWLGRLSWPRQRQRRIDDGNRILHRSEMKTFVRRGSRLIRRLRDPVKGGYGLGGIIER
jgi:hypothetical protein